VETVERPAEVTWHPLRPLLGVRAIGVSAFSAAAPGETVIEPHVESTDGRGHEELYVVIAGDARFTVGDDEFDAAAGTVVLVSDPDLRRAAIATEADRLVLAVGGPPTFEPAGSEWLELARPHFETDPERAAALLDEGSEEIPNSAAIPFGRALLAATHGRDEEALARLREAIAREPRLRAEAEREGPLAPLVGRLD